MFFHLSFFCPWFVQVLQQQCNYLVHRRRRLSSWQFWHYFLSWYSPWRKIGLQLGHCCQFKDVSNRYLILQDIHYGRYCNYYRWLLSLQLRFRWRDRTWLLYRSWQLDECSSLWPQKSLIRGRMLDPAYCCYINDEPHDRWLLLGILWSKEEHESTCHKQDLSPWYSSDRILWLLGWTNRFPWRHKRH